MIRLTVRNQTPEEARLQVDGTVAEEGVRVLEQEGSRLLQESRRLILDLKGVIFIDEAGLALLQGWSGARLVLRNGPPFIRALLDRHGLRYAEEEHP